MTETARYRPPYIQISMQRTRRTLLIKIVTRSPKPNSSTMRNLFVLLLSLKRKLSVSLSCISSCTKKKTHSSHFPKPSLVLSLSPCVPEQHSNPNKSATTRPSVVHRIDDDKWYNDQQINEPYVSDIYDYLRTMEKKNRPMVGYIENIQTEITTETRGRLVDWIVRIADKCKLYNDTLHLSISYIDRFLSIQPITRSKLQLLGVSSMHIATKYEQGYPINAARFFKIADMAEIIKMEAEILKSLNFEMGNPHVNTFLKEFVGFATEENLYTSKLQMKFLCDYIAELSLLEYECIRFLPSIVAASVVFLARFIICPEVHPWTLSLSERLGYKSCELKECVLILHDLFMARKAAFLKASWKKYKQPEFKYVASLRSPLEVPNHYFEQE